MNNMKDILRGIKDRLSSPLIFSFLLSWLIFNWEITVALLWYDVAYLKIEGNTLIDFIRARINPFDSFYYPLIFALAYTLLSPPIKVLISAFNTWISKKGENWNVQISKGAKVPIEKFLTLRENFEKRSAILEDAISKESTTLEDLEKLNTAFLQTREEQNRMMTQISDLRAITDNIYRSDILNGPWIRTVYRALGNEQIENIQIHNGRVSVTENGQKIDKYQIEHFMYDSNSNRMHFALHLIEKDGSHGSALYAFDNLNFEHKHLIGNEYSSGGSARVTYTKPTTLLSAEVTKETDKKENE